MSEDSLPDRVIAAFGTRAELARALGLSYTTVDGWQRSGRIPAWRLRSIREAARLRDIALPVDFPSEEAA